MLDSSVRLLCPKAQFESDFKPDNEISQVPRMALTVGVATVLDSREVIVVVTGQRKALALSKAIEEGVNHLVRSFKRNLISFYLHQVDPVCLAAPSMGSHCGR